MCSRRLQDMSSKRLQDMSPRHLQDISSRRLEDQQMFAANFLIFSLLHQVCIKR